MASSSKSKLPANPRLRSLAYEDKIRRGGRPRKVEDELSPNNRNLSKFVIALLIFVVVGSAVFQLIQIVLSRM